MNLAVIIVTYITSDGQMESFRRLLASLHRQTYKRYLTVIVDNNSRKKYKEHLNSGGYDADVILLEKNSGYAAACNKGLRKAVRKGYNRFFLLNQDVELEDHALASLEESSGDEDGIVAPVVLWGGERRDKRLVHTFGVRADFRSNTQMFLFHKHCLDEAIIPDRITTNMFNGAAFMVSAGLLEEIGGFDESYFMYGEEMDFAYRAAGTRFNIVHIKSSQVWHHGEFGRGNRDRHYFRYYYIMRNKILFYRKFGMSYSLVREVIVNMISFPAKLLWAYRTAGTGLLKYYYLGICRGLLGERGRSLQLPD